MSLLEVIMLLQKHFDLVFCTFVTPCFCVVSVQTPGFSVALGLVVHGLSVSGHGKAEDIHPRLLAAWIKILLAEVLLLLTATLDTVLPSNLLNLYTDVPSPLPDFKVSLKASQTSETSCLRVSWCYQCELPANI